MNFCCRKAKTAVLLQKPWFTAFLSRMSRKTQHNSVLRIPFWENWLMRTSRKCAGLRIIQVTWKFVKLCVQDPRNYFYSGCAPLPSFLERGQMKVFLIRIKKRRCLIAAVVLLTVVNIVIMCLHLTQSHCEPKFEKYEVGGTGGSAKDQAHRTIDFCESPP